ncbi:DNA-directed RNA polymerase subunit H [Candidatus Micrarchaeota archaeon]|nr:DNA-directed RNA polymerase subunit H [Candidatus Micrarchaeota archaeon]MBU1930851.1 DNA-directed RNA polymerase subunit H [Candidatus Micrarchaeota archaeon]
MTQELLQNKLVPWHEIVLAPEKDQILKKYGLSQDRLPQLLRDDPIVQALEANRGDLIRIIRNSPTAGMSTYYRIVE